jgi:hypothetical protein
VILGHVAKSDYWELLLGRGIQGRLGLFHFIQRILQTLRKQHPDYFRCLNCLLHAVYFYNQADYEALLHALKEGTLWNDKLADDDISELKGTKTFRQRDTIVTYGRRFAHHMMTGLIGTNVVPATKPDRPLVD